MQETPMLFPMSSVEFWKQIKTIMEEVVEQKLNASIKKELPHSHLPEKALLKATEVCQIFQVSKPTLYEWMRQDKLKSFKIRSRRYFCRADIEAMINHPPVVNH
ncbi:MAG: helix-turn-helix domain-containing protein [Flavobacterium sp.]|uniref:helix-turn-helix domain-containing protein n=1 Tax=Flavobacterium sp. TaxID=239 RepID=UPI00326302E5